MNIFRISFIGHRQISSVAFIENQVERLAAEFMRQADFVEFYLGRNGEFDIAAASGIKRAQKRIGHEKSALILVLPYEMKDLPYYQAFYDEVILPVDSSVHFKLAITKRNKWMVESTDLLIAYVTKPQGGAYHTLCYAQSLGRQICNLGEGKRVDF